MQKKGVILLTNVGTISLDVLQTIIRRKIFLKLCYLNESDSNDKSTTTESYTKYNLLKFFLRFFCLKWKN